MAVILLFLLVSALLGLSTGKPSAQERVKRQTESNYYFSTTDWPNYDRPPHSTTDNYNAYTSRYGTTDNYNNGYTSRYGTTDNYNNGYSSRYGTTDNYNNGYTSRYGTTDNYNNGYSSRYETTHGYTPVIVYGPGNDHSECYHDFGVPHDDKLTIDNNIVCGTGVDEYPNNAYFELTLWMFGDTYLNIEYDVDIEADPLCSHDKLSFSDQTDGLEINMCGMQTGNFSVPVGDRYTIRFVSDGNVTRRGFRLAITADVYAYFSTTDRPHYLNPPSGGMSSHAYDYDTTTSYYTHDSTNYDTTDRGNADYFGTTSARDGQEHFEERKTVRLETMRTELRELVDSVREAVLAFDDFESAYYEDTPEDPYQDSPMAWM